MDMQQKITVNEAAKMIEQTPLYVRIGLRLGRLPFGTAVQMPGGRWSYDIRPKALERYINIGLTVEELELSEGDAGLYSR